MINKSNILYLMNIHVVQKSLLHLCVVIFILYETNSATSSCHDQNGRHVSINSKNKRHLILLSSYISLPPHPLPAPPLSPAPKMPTQNLQGTRKNVHNVTMLRIIDIQIFLLEKDNAFLTGFVPNNV